MERRKLRVVFFGTAEFAVPSLEALLEAGHAILAVVTQPDKPQGRGRQLAASPVKKTAERHGLTVLQPKRVRAASFIETMRALAPDVLALAAFGQIIPQALLDLPPLGPINVHGSLLPKYRGAAPIQRAIMAGETVTGVTTMWMEATLDTGDVLLAESVPIEPDDTAGTLTPKLAALGARLLVDTLDGLAAGTIARHPQDDSLATYAPAITPEDGYLRWEEPAEVIRNRLRGVTPKPGAFAAIKGRRVKVWSAQVASASVGDALPGTVLALSRAPSGVLVAAGAGTALLLTEVQPESGRRMPAADWARGLHLTPGDVCAALTAAASLSQGEG
ncbi:MAG TPA: methionyl-tRNA formyltransferase [Chthonomonadaceae bacterium]|nr:methionyl-tRNA formyltransferase [Chthonomonadaceae bacterium]